ncbi:MAG: hypothetical protein KKE62_10205 [Proteobacteria bacterium]|nr:hypothetical protein [Pseudomonadota bacterium]MBU1387500.1 hypothetical protein [Pseudomonadota bacterium]MBU1543199.1 hypothetical protein [Pseudomonadota bacterium]MBU2480278.1 hypothetical protein [Pseudomonadota bacterium]
MKKKSCLAVPLFFLILCFSAQAATTFTDRAAWEVAVAGISTRTFDGIQLDSAPTITLPDGMISTVGSTLYTYGINTVTSDEFGGRIGDLYSHPETITWIFPNSIIGFFADFDYINEYVPFHIIGNFDGTGEMSIDFPSGELGVSGGFGIIGSASFSSLRFDTDDSSQYFYIDNFSTATTLSSVPVPSAVWILGMGISGLAGIRIRGKIKRRTIGKK